MRRSPRPKPSSSARSTSGVLEDVVGHVERVHEVPPGVDVEEFAPRSRDDALRRLLAEVRADPPNPGNVNERLPDEGNADRLAEFFAEDEPTVLYFGKLLYNKGVHVLFEASAGRPRAPWSSASATIAPSSSARRRRERSSPARSSIATWSTSCRSPT